jgi:hypothetical protein
MKIERRLQLGPDREGVSSITCESEKNFMFDLLNIVHQSLFRFQDIFRCHNASFARILRVAKSRKAAAARSDKRRHLCEVCGREVSPTPEALREQSRTRQETSERAENVTALYVATYPLALAPVAEAIEQGDEFESAANIEHCEERRVRVPGFGARHLAPKLYTESNTGESRSQIGAWRARAEELRAAANRFVLPTAQEALRRAAGNYDALADDAEALAKHSAKMTATVLCDRIREQGLP